VECIDDGDEVPVDVGAGGDGGDGERAMIVDCVDVLVYVCEFDATDVIVPVECLGDVFVLVQFSGAKAQLSGPGLKRWGPRLDSRGPRLNSRGPRQKRQGPSLKPQGPK